MPYCPFFFHFPYFFTFHFPAFQFDKTFQGAFFFQLSRVLVRVASRAVRPRSRRTTFRSVISFHPIASFSPFIHLSCLVHPKLYKTSCAAIFFALDITNYHYHHHHNIIMTSYSFRECRRAGLQCK